MKAFEKKTDLAFDRQNLFPVDGGCGILRGALKMEKNSMNLLNDGYIQFDVGYIEFDKIIWL